MGAITCIDTTIGAARIAGTSLPGHITDQVRALIFMTRSLSTSALRKRTLAAEEDISHLMEKRRLGNFDFLKDWLIGILTPQP